MNSLLIILLSTGAVAGFFGLMIGALIGARIGREMAETRVIDYTNKHPFDCAYEVSDELYPHRVPLMIEVKGKPPVVKSRILRKHWRFN